MSNETKAPQPPAEAQPCGCGEATCTVPWEPGCGLGKSEQHAEAQPAADGGFTAADMMDARQEGRKEAQQPAAVDGALRAEVSDLMQAAGMLAVERAEFRIRAERLAEALSNILPFAEHSDSCGDRDAYNLAVVRTCDCGLDSLLETIAALRDHDKERSDGHV